MQNQDPIIRHHQMALIKKTTETLLRSSIIYLDCKQKDPDVRGKDQRAAIMASLAATVEFLREIGTPEDLRNPLVHLATALSDLDKGAVDPILKPARTGKRSEAPQSAWLTKAGLGMALKFRTVGLGELQKVAAKTVEKDARAYGVRAEKRVGATREIAEPVANDIINWMKECDAKFGGRNMSRDMSANFWREYLSILREAQFLDGDHKTETMSRYYLDCLTHAQMRGVTIPTARGYKK